MTAVSKGYELRPEIIESAYYLHYFIHDPRYVEMGKTFFDSLVKYCRTDVAYAALNDVEKKTKKDEMESFFFAETLKYSYLLFASPDTTRSEQSCIQHGSSSHPQDLVGK